jgi:hypothetical protein
LIATDLVLGGRIAMKLFPLLRLAFKLFETTTIITAAGSTNGSVVGPLRVEVLRAFS